MLPEDRPIDSRFLDTLLTALSPTVNRILRPMTLSTVFDTVPVVGAHGEVKVSDAPLTRSPERRELTNASGSTEFAKNMPTKDPQEGEGGEDVLDLHRWTSFSARTATSTCQRKVPRRPLVDAEARVVVGERRA